MRKKVDASIQFALLLQWLCCNHLNGVLGFSPSLSHSKLPSGTKSATLRTTSVSFLSQQESHDDNDGVSTREIMTNSDHVDYWGKRYQSSIPTRRQLLQNLSKAIGVGGSSTILATMMAPYSSFSIASAEEDSTVVASGSVSLEELSSRLRMVPTFSVVDKRGVPFMVVGEDAKLTAYFFTSYKEASRILRVASDSSDKAIAEYKKEVKEKKLDVAEEDEPINPWKEARISSVPLDFAVTLANKGKLGGAYFRIAPSEVCIETHFKILENINICLSYSSLSLYIIIFFTNLCLFFQQKDDIEDALSIDKSVDDLSEGKVPLFYLDNFELKNTEKKQIPLYFRKEELLQEWKRQNPKEKSPPTILVTELFSVLTEMVSPKTETTDPDVEFLTFIPPKESSLMEKKCIKQGGKEKQFILGERIIVL